MRSASKKERKDIANLSNLKQSDAGRTLSHTTPGLLTEKPNGESGNQGGGSRRKENSGETWRFRMETQPNRVERMRFHNGFACPSVKLNRLPA